MKLTMRSTRVLVILLMILGNGALWMTGAVKIVCKSKITKSDNCNRNKDFIRCNISGKVINITNVFYKIKTNTFNNCNCEQNTTDITIESNVKKACNDNAYCNITETDLYNNSGRYFIEYHCIEAITTTKSPITTKSTTAMKLRTTVKSTTALTPPTSPLLTKATKQQTTSIKSSTTATKPTLITTATATRTIYTGKTNTLFTLRSTTIKPIPDIPGETDAQTGSDELPIVSIAAPVATVVVLALVVLAVVCIIRFKRQKNRGHNGNYADVDKNKSDNQESFSNPAYVSDGLKNISSKPFRSVERTSSFSNDSGYAECQDVGNMDADNGEYNTITFNQTESNFDEAYSHIPKQSQMVDNTYSHLTPEQITQSGASNYSHVNSENTGLHFKINVNESTYNTLQTQATKHQTCHSVTDDVPEHEYNHANFGPMSSHQDSNQTEYSNLNSLTNCMKKPPSQQISPSSKDAEYVEVVQKQQHQQDINADNGHTYFVLQKGEDGTKKDKKEDNYSENNAHTYFVLEEDPVHANVNAESMADSTQHDYFVLIKQ